MSWPDDEAMHHRPVAHVAAHEPHVVAQLGIDFVEPAVPVEPGVERKRRDLGAVAHKLLREMRADEAIGAGDEDLSSRRTCLVRRLLMAAAFIRGPVGGQATHRRAVRCQIRWLRRPRGSPSSFRDLGRGAQRVLLLLPRGVDRSRFDPRIVIIGRSGDFASELPEGCPSIVSRDAFARGLSAR